MKKVNLSLIKNGLFEKRSIEIIDKYLESIMFSRKFIGKGVSTCCFDSPNYSNFISCYTVDFLKVLYLKKSNAPGFKFVKFIEFESEVIYLYEMEKLEMITDFSEFKEFEALENEYLDSESEELISIMDNYIDTSIINNLAFKYNKYVDIYSDITVEQFGVDINTREVYCFDPFISSNIIR